MREHIRKAQSNERLIEYLTENIPDDYFDWKTTIAFYAAMHYIKAFFKFKNKVSGHSHKELNHKINPSSKSAILPFPQEIYECYRELYQNARNTRYEPYLDGDIQNLVFHINFDLSMKHIKNIKDYLISEGLKI